MENENQVFQYTYSAKEQAELDRIRGKYLPPAENKMDQLRQLDRIPAQKAQGWAIALGVIGMLIMGTGMSLAMTDLGAAMGAMAMVIGIIVGVVGLVLVALAYPVYNHILKKERQRIAPEILRLTDELMR